MTSGIIIISISTNLKEFFFTSVSVRQLHFHRGHSGGDVGFPTYHFHIRRPTVEIGESHLGNTWNSYAECWEGVLRKSRNMSSSEGWGGRICWCCLDILMTQAITIESSINQSSWWLLPDIGCVVSNVELGNWIEVRWISYDRGSDTLIIVPISPPEIIVVVVTDFGGHHVPPPFVHYQTVSQLGYLVQSEHKQQRHFCFWKYNNIMCIILQVQLSV